MGVDCFPADEGLRKKALEAVQAVAPEVRAFEGRVCSGDKFISTKEQKDTIIKNFGGMCCEMEGAAIAQTCYLNSTPFVIIRAISDKPDGGGSVDFNEFQAEAAARCAAIVQYIVERL
jgi:adenosylhomocysteine nucleosidase